MSGCGRRVSPVRGMQPIGDAQRVQLSPRPARRSMQSERRQTPAAQREAKRLPPTQYFVLRQRPRGVADVVDEGLDQRTHSSILQRHDRDRPGKKGKIDRQYLEREVLACEMQHVTRLYCNKSTGV